MNIELLNLETRVQYDQLGIFLKLKYHIFELRTEKYLGDTIESGDLSILYTYIPTYSNLKTCKKYIIRQER